MRYDNLPIYKSAMDLCVYVETIVRNFEKYHKYTIGTDLRNISKELLFLIHRANISHTRVQIVEKLRNRCEDMKMLIQLAKELKAFRSFKQFEYASKLSVGVCRQAQGWLGKSAGVTR